MKQKYYVERRYYTTFLYEVKAKDEQEAMEMAYKMYENGDLGKHNTEADANEWEGFSKYDWLIYNCEDVDDNK